MKLGRLAVAQIRFSRLGVERAGAGEWHRLLLVKAFDYGLEPCELAPQRLRFLPRFAFALGVVRPKHGAGGKHKGIRDGLEEGGEAFGGVGAAQANNGFVPAVCPLQTQYAGGMGVGQSGFFLYFGRVAAAQVLSAAGDALRLRVLARHLD